MTAAWKKRTMELMKLDKGWKRVWIYYLYLWIGWGLFRWLFNLPEAIEELWIKPVIWLLPIWFIRANQKKRANWFEGDGLKAIAAGLGLGVLYSGVTILSKMKAGVGFEGWFGVEGWWMVGVGLITAIVEQLAFAGFIFYNLKDKFENKWALATLVGIMFGLMHIPIGVSMYGLQGWGLILIVGLFGLIQIGNVWLVGVTGNVISAIIAHWLVGIWWG